MASSFADLLHCRNGVRQDERIIVPVNQVKIAFWPPETHIRYLATGFLNSCTALAIISPQAGILAHIAPIAPGSTTQSLEQTPNAALANARPLIAAVAQLYRAHQSKFNPSQTIVVAGIFNGNPAMADVIRMISAFATQLALPVTWKSYNVTTAQDRPEGHTSVIIYAAQVGSMPIVYMSTMTGAVRLYP